jgi:ABC-type nitrate/sulfonate/bicarbonate transport system substrate-binding protein
MNLRRGVSRATYAVIGVVLILIVVAGGYVLLTPAKTSSSTSSSTSSTTSNTTSTTTSTTPLVKGSLILGTFGSGSIANVANAGQSAEWLANPGGFYQQQGVNVTIDALQSSAVILQALESGSINVADISATEAFKTTALGQANFTAIMGEGASDCFTCLGGFFIIGKSSITNVSDLQGKNVGISGVGGQDQQEAIAVLKALNVPYNPATAINWVPVSTVQARVAGLQQGSLDATVTTAQNLPALNVIPNLTFIVNATTFATLAPPVVPGIIVKTSFLQSNTALLQEFVKGLITANRAFASNMTMWLNLAEKARPDMNSTQLTTLYTGYSHGFTINGGINMSRAQLGVNYLYTTSEFTSQNVPVISALKFVNTTLVDNVLRQLGVVSAFDGIGRTISGATTTSTLAMAVLPLQSLAARPEQVLGKR